MSRFTLPHQLVGLLVFCTLKDSSPLLPKFMSNFHYYFLYCHQESDANSEALKPAVVSNTPIAQCHTVESSYLPQQQFIYHTSPTDSTVAAANMLMMSSFSKPVAHLPPQPPPPTSTSPMAEQVARGSSSRNHIRLPRPASLSVEDTQQPLPPRSNSTLGVTSALAELTLSFPPSTSTQSRGTPTTCNAYVAPPRHSHNRGGGRYNWRVGAATAPVTAVSSGPVRTNVVSSLRSPSLSTNGSERYHVRTAGGVASRYPVETVGNAASYANGR